MNASLMDQLHDIEGLDPVGWWPLALGWWILIAIAVLILFGAAWAIAYRIAYQRSWKNDTLLKLSVLEKHLTDETAREALMTLSEYLRRIVLRHFPRKECAALTGEAWLKWLASHDPKAFDWEIKGVLLIELPYAPLDSPAAASQVKDLIHAVKQWVR